MEKLFVFESELEAFKVRHPEYTNYEKVYDDQEKFVGYVALVENHNIGKG